uniref:Snf2 histone linker phd ring helicase n=1 Tax=Rhizophora mucronata TaxID=61149 RepID=A0A2P2MDB5_RHIMU
MSNLPHFLELGASSRVFAIKSTSISVDLLTPYLTSEVVTSGRNQAIKFIILFFQSCLVVPRSD